MDNKKKAAFVSKMGKKKLKMIKKPHFGLGGLLGVSGGAGGSGFSTQAGATAEQLAQAYNANQNALNSQGALMGTLTPQAAQAVNAQNVLSGQFANQAVGAGPNVAQNVLNQATQANVANQAALMAGQRGAGTNPALIARQAAQQGAAAQQQAAGQAATMQAQQQIAAQQAQAQLAANQIAQTQGATTANTQAQQAEQGILQGANTAYNNIQGQLANTTMQGQQGLMGGLMNAAGGAFGLAEGGEVKKDHHGHKKLEFIHKMAKMGMEHFDEGGMAVPNVTYNAPQSAGFAPPQQVEGGFSPGSNEGAKAMGESMKHHEKKKPEPTPMGTTNVATNPNITGGSTTSPFVESVMPVSSGSANMAGPFAANGGEISGPNQSYIANYLMASGGKSPGKIPAMVSPGEIYLTPEKVDAVVKANANPLAIGEKIPGQAPVKGNSFKNDVVEKDLDEGGVIIKRTEAKNPTKASRFVHKAIAKKKVRGK